MRLDRLSAQASFDFCGFEGLGLQLVPFLFAVVSDVDEERTLQVSCAEATALPDAPVAVVGLPRGANGHRAGINRARGDPGNAGSTAADA